MLVLINTMKINNVNANATSIISTLINTMQINNVNENVISIISMLINTAKINNAIECDGGEKCVPPVQCDKN